MTIVVTFLGGNMFNISLKMKNFETNHFFVFFSVLVRMGCVSQLWLCHLMQRGFCCSKYVCFDSGKVHFVFTIMIFFQRERIICVVALLFVGFCFFCFEICATSLGVSGFLENLLEKTHQT